MATLVYILVLLALTGYSSGTYCLCRDGVGTDALQKAIDYACGNGADCSQIQQNGACYQPNTVKDHCNYAVNSYFQRKGQSVGSCDFSGTATQSANPPSSQTSTCVYPSTSSPTTSTGTPTPPGTPTTPTTPTTTTPMTPTTPTPPSTSTPGTITSPTFGGISPSGTGIYDNGNNAAKLAPIATFVLLIASALGPFLLIN